jgi:poly-gamma-glutamate capsule biosynthesis protein CapA/YwtB (metallophosphatase superfamily)
MMRDVRLFLAGDVMTGRGVDQILPHPGDPTLREPYVRDARSYVELAEAVNGPIPAPVDYAWPWGDALAAIDEFEPDARLVNLETSVTRSDDVDPRKGIHYRMSPENAPCLTAARLDVCALANNHVLDFGIDGLEETLETLARAGLVTAGAGADADRAWRPAVIDVEGSGRVVVFAVGAASSGVPQSWAAAQDQPGISFLSDLTEAEICDRVAQAKRRGDLVVASIHWGANWGYQVHRDEIRFAHRLVDCGVDVVHGHSAHHPRPFEVYRGRLILYGCGDLIDDYEGIAGYEKYRDDLRLLYFATVVPLTGVLATLTMVPMQVRGMRLHRASVPDATWLLSVLNRISRSHGSQVRMASDGTLALVR